MSRIIFILLVCFCSTLRAASFFVATNGLSSNSGRHIGAPWDLQTALTNTVAVQPGDTIWLRDGTYGVGSNVYTCSLVGSSGNPITVRSWSNERAIINGGIAAPQSSSWVTFRGFEITCTNPRISIYSMRPAGLEMDGVGHKAVDMLVYDAGHPGIGSFQNEGAGREIYGCILSGNGIYQYSDNGDIDPVYTPSNTYLRGSALYLQCKTNGFLVTDNVSQRNFTSGMKAYSEGGFVNGFVFDGNITFRNNVAGIETDCLYNSMTNLVVANNYGYRTSGMTMGYFNDSSGALAHQTGLIYTNNYEVDVGGYREAILWLKRWHDMVVRGNTLIATANNPEWSTGDATSGTNGAAGKFIELYPSTNIVSYVINSNSYYGGVEKSADYFDSSMPDFLKYQPFRYNQYTNEFSFGRWTNTYGFDLNSTYSTNLPTVNVVVIRTNKYEPGRAHIAIYNWASNTTATVNLAGVGLQENQRFEIRDVQDYFGTPEIAPTWFKTASPTVSLSLTRTNVTTPVGTITHMAEDPLKHTAYLFNCFVVLPLGSPPHRAVGGGGGF